MIGLKKYIYIQERQKGGRYILGLHPTPCSSAMLDPRCRTAAVLAGQVATLQLAVQLI